MPEALSIPQVLKRRRMIFTSELVRAARALLRWEQRDLAEASGVSLPSIKRLEIQPGPLAAQDRTVEAIRQALEVAGVIFVAENGEGPGVRLRKRPESAAELTRQIDVIEDDLAETEGPSAQTPAGGMQRLERAHKREAVKKLKNRRTKLEKK